MMDAIASTCELGEPAPAAVPKAWSNKRRCPICGRVLRRYRGTDGLPWQSCRETADRRHFRSCPSCGRELQKYRNGEDKPCSVCRLKDRATLRKWRLQVREGISQPELPGAIPASPATAA